MGREHEIHVRRQFEAPLRRLWEAWSDAEQLARWSWGSIGRSTRAEVDFRVGGSLRVETRRADGTTWSFSGTYTEIKGGARIAHTLAWHAPMGYPESPEVLAAEFAGGGRGCTVELIHTGVPDEKSAEVHRKGWIDVLDTLAAHVEKDARRR